MTLIADLNQASNWEEKWMIELVATPVGTTGHLILPEQICPFVFHSPLIAIWCEAPQRRPSWRYGGLLAQKVATALTVGNNQNVATSKGHAIYVDRLMLLHFDKFAVADYSLTFKPAYWHKEVRLLIWEYVGELITTVEAAIEDINDVQISQLGSLLSKLQEIEIKVDSLL